MRHGVLVQGLRGVAPCVALLLTCAAAHAQAGGQIVSWGNDAKGSQGQSGRPSASILRYTDVACGKEFALALKSDGTLAAWGDNMFSVCGRARELSSITQIACGQSHAAAVRNDATVVCWGFNGSGQTDTPAALRDVKQVACGSNFTLALKLDGHVAGWGLNSDGQCGGTDVRGNPLAAASAGDDVQILGATLGRVTQIAAGEAHAAALKDDGSMVVWGSNDSGQSTLPLELIAAGTTLRQVACGAYHTVALRMDGTVVCFGAGTFVDLGAPYRHWGQSITPRGLAGVKKIVCGGFHTMAVTADDALVAWGSGQAPKVSDEDFYNYGQARVPDLLQSHPNGPAERVSRLAGGLWNTLVLTKNGKTLAWGANYVNQCQPPSALGGVVEISAGGNHFVALQPGGWLSMWGSNYFGECDMPIMANAGSTIQHAVGGSLFTAALRLDGSVATWGRNNRGQCMGSDAGGMAIVSERSTGTLVQVGGLPLSGAKAIAAGYEHMMAIKADDSVVCWGNTDDGRCQTPIWLGPVVKIAAGTSHSVALQLNGEVVAWGTNASGECLGTDKDGKPLSSFGDPLPWDQPVRILGLTLTDVTQVAAGREYSAALRSNGRVVCWGWNGFGQTDVPSDLDQVVSIAGALHHIAALKSDGTVVAWGGNQGGQCDTPVGLSGVTHIAASSSTTIALLDSSLSTCGSRGSAGDATLLGSGVYWNDVNVWGWTGGGKRLPGGLSSVNLGTYGSVGSECEATAGTFTASSGTSLVISPVAALPVWDCSVRVSTTANLAGRVWLTAAASATGALPADLDVPVLSAASVNGFFDLIQSDLPAPAGKFLTLVPHDVNGRTVFSLRLLDLPGNAELTSGSTGNFSGAAVAAATIDINHDGFDDLALAIDFGAGQPGLIQILLNDGTGNLGGSSVLESIPAQPTCMAAGDVDGDGNKDLFVGIASDDTARVYLDNGLSSLTAGDVINVTNGTPTAVMVLANSGSSFAMGSSKVVTTSNSKLQIYGNTTLQQEFTVAGTPSTVSGGDTKGTGGSTIVTGGTTSNTFGLLPSAETGFVQTLVRGANGQYAINQTFGLTAKPVALDVADIDGDGLADIVSANADPVQPAPGSALPVLSIFRNNGGSFKGGTPYKPEGANSARSVALIDVDNDGDRDIVSVNNKIGGSEATLLRIDTLGAGMPLSVGQTTVLPASNPIIATRGNLDGVGGEDLFLVGQSGGSSFAGFNQVKPFLGVAGLQGDLDGDGQVSSSDLGLLLLDFGPCPGMPCLSDLDGDGEVGAGDIAVLLMLYS